MYKSKNHIEELSTRLQQTLDDDDVMMLFKKKENQTILYSDGNNSISLIIVLGEKWYECVFEKF